MKINDALAGALLMALGIAVLLATRGYPQIHGQQIGPAVFPSVVALVMIGCAAILMFNGWRTRAQHPWFSVPDWLGSRRHVAAFVMVIAATIVYIALGQILGFFIIGTVTLLALFLVLRVKPLLATVTAIVATAVIWYAFYKLLRVPLPWGVFQAFAF
ncbi:MAG: tripartite tricarboxylate transporter TctB family protein [Betaproteobacteria bacterium]